MTRKAFFAIVVILLGAYFCLRTTAHVAMHAGLPIGFSIDDPVYALWNGKDIRVYIHAAENILARKDIYPAGEWGESRVTIDPELAFLHNAASTDEFSYSPLFAYATSLITATLPYNIHSTIHALITLAAYAGLFLTWRFIFRRMDLEGASRALFTLLPVWFLYTAWWGDVTLLNIYILLSLSVSWLFFFLWREKTIPSAILLILILQVKPQMAFGLLLPLLIGRYGFFLRLAVCAAAGYLALAGAGILLLGTEYGLQLYASYFQFLSTVHENTTWLLPGSPIGYDNSLAQIFIHFFGYAPENWLLLTGIKLLLLMPLAWASIRFQRLQQSSATPTILLGFFFALYYASFLWLDLVWETTLSIIVFTYLFGTVTNRTLRWAALIPFLLYALVDTWQFSSYGLMDLAEYQRHGPPFWADPSYFIPVIMIVILTGYAILLWQVIRQTRPQQ